MFRLSHSFPVHPWEEPGSMFLSFPLSNWRQQWDFPLSFSSGCEDLGLDLVLFVPQSHEPSRWGLSSCWYFNVLFYNGQSKLNEELQMWYHKSQRQAPQPQHRFSSCYIDGFCIALLLPLWEIVFSCKRSISRTWVLSYNVLLILIIIVCS